MDLGSPGQLGQTPARIRPSIGRNCGFAALKRSGLGFHLPLASASLALPRSLAACGNLCRSRMTDATVQDERSHHATDFSISSRAAGVVPFRWPDCKCPGSIQHEKHAADHQEHSTKHEEHPAAVTTGCDWWPAGRQWQTRRVRRSVERRAGVQGSADEDCRE